MSAASEPEDSIGCPCRWRGIATIPAALLGDRAGAAVVEFGFGIALFLMFLLGVIEFSRALWTENALQFSVEQASRYVIANPTATDGQIASYASSQLAAVDPAAVAISVSRDSFNGIAFVTVTASYPFNPVAPIVDIPAINLAARSRVSIAS
jgi:Flp pilus assembly protein TadG